MRSALCSVVVLVAILFAMARAEGQTVKLSPPQRAGNSTVRIAFVPTGLEWLGEQKYFVIDNRRVELPPLRLGYHRVFSAPRWITRNGRIVALKFWQFDTEKSLRRAVELSFPGYGVLSRGTWQTSPGGDTVPDPPR